MYETTSLSDWLSGLSAGMAGLALICLALSFADADWADFDLRPVLRRLVESGRRPLRDAAVSVAALLLFLNTAEVTR